jgi:hypothetical protein
VQSVTRKEQRQVSAPYRTLQSLHTLWQAHASGAPAGLSALGHLSGSLPLGNPGRSTVRAFEPLPVRPELACLIAQARTGKAPTA